MQILEFESAAVTHNEVLHQSASEVASWKIYGKRIWFHQPAYYYIYLLLHMLGLSGINILFHKVSSVSHKCLL